MDVFKLLDDSIRGVVSFAKGILTTTFTLIGHPISGPHRLWHAHHSSLKQQISPVTYLALSLAYIAFILPSPEFASGGEHRDISPLDVLVAVTTGSLSTSLLPLLAGSIVATIVIDMLLRVIGSRLRSRRRDRFVGIMEYEFACFMLLAMAPVATLVRISEDGWLFTLVLIPFYGVGAVVAVHFYSLLLRNGRWYRFVRSLLLPSRSAWRAGPTAWLPWAARQLLLWPTPSLRFLVVGYFKIFAVTLLVIAPLLVMTVGRLTGELTSGWLLAQQIPEPSLTILSLRCNLAARPMTVHGIAWNGSTRPAVGWINNMVLEVRTGEMLETHTLQWRPVRDPARSSDFLPPGQTREFEGIILDSPQAQAIQRQRPPDATCAVGSRSGTITIRSEGSSLLLPPADQMP